MLQRGLFLLITSDNNLAHEIGGLIQRHGILRSAGTSREAQAKLASTSVSWTGVVVDLQTLAAERGAVLAQLRQAVPLVPMLWLAAGISAQLINSAHALRVELVAQPAGPDNLTSFLRRALVSAWLPDERIAAWVNELACRRSLSSREVQLMAFVLGDESREGVMRRLGITENTLKTQVRALLRKCGARSLDGLAKNVLREALLFRAPEAAGSELTSGAA